MKGRRFAPHRRSRAGASERTSLWMRGSSPVVGSSRTTRSGRLMNAWMSPSFWRFPLESWRTGRSRTTPKRSQSRSRNDSSTVPRSRASESSCSRPVSRSDRRVTWQIPQMAPGSNARRPGVVAKDRRAAPAWSEETNEESDRRALPRAVRPEKAEHFARLDAEVEVGERPEFLSVRLGQAGNLDRGPSRHTPIVVGASTAS